MNPRRLAALLVTLFLTLVGGVTLAGTATAGDVCPDTTFTADDGGWVKYDGLSGTTFDVPQKSGYTVTDICYKAADELRWPGVTSTVTSTVLNRSGQVQELSHVSVYYEKDAPVVTTETVYELDCDYLLTTTVITYTDGEETDREQSTSTIDAETAAELGLMLPYECEVPVPVVTTETEYMLDCDYLLTTTVRTYTDEVLTDTEVTTETITAEAAAELGLALPTDCELPTVVVTPPTVVVNPPAVVVTPAAPARPARAMPTFTG